MGLTEAQRRAVVDAFHSAAAAGKSRPECYVAAIDALHAMVPDAPRNAVAAEAVRIVVHDPSFAPPP
jgi:hypothetical protein